MPQILLALLPALLFAAQADPPRAPAPGDWKDKPVDQWTVPDAQAVIASSPWVKTVTPSRGAAISSKPALPAVRLFGHAAAAATPAATPKTPSALPALTLRWESALPVLEARRKLGGNTLIDNIDPDHYVIAVYGIPKDLLTQHQKESERELKAHATLKMYAKKDREPSSVEILQSTDGPVLLFFFPKKDEITWRDHRIQFDAQVANLRISQAFDTFDMRFHNKLEL